MNAVEIEEAISALAEQPFDAQEFPFAFLQAFGNKDTTLKRLRKGESNKSDLGGVLQTNNIHIAVAAPGKVTKTLAALKASPATGRAKAKFVLATDGETFEAEDVASGETVACSYADFPDHFGFFLPLAGISTVKQVRDSSFDIRATSRLNRLYVELLKDNPKWGTTERRPDMNHFMARLIFCFFAEDTDIFNGTGLFTVKTPGGRILRVADLVDDDPAKRDRVSAALKDPEQKNNRDHVDIIITLGMAKEGFDWIWCDHALTVGYRSSLTEIVQIIGRATRDAPGKTRTRFTNLIAEPDASEAAVTEAVNDTLKAIAASLLMEQVLAPRFEFKPKNPASGPVEGFDYGEGGYDPNKCNVGFNEETGRFQIEIKGLAEPKSKEAARICQEDLNEVIAAFVQDKTAIERGLFDEDLVPEELTQVRMGKIIKGKYPELDEEDQEAVRQHAITALNLTQQAKQVALGGGDTEPSANTALIDGVRRFAMDVRELDIDLIDRINPFGEAYAILAKTMSEHSLKQVAAAIAAKRTSLTPEEAKELAVRAVRFKKERGRLPSISSTDAWEKRMAEGAAAFVRFKDDGRYE